MPNIDAGVPPTGSASDLPIVEASSTELAWGDCSSFGAPSIDVLGTSGWECTRLTAAMDPFGDVSVSGDVELALTRHPATGDRRGAIVLNPGGPGGAGLPMAWNVRGGMPADILRGFDIVSWDPRGVGQSFPKIDCDDAVVPGDEDFITRCAEVTGPLAAFLSAPYSAEDMEAIRVALGEPKLNYFGYSYGSILGATYAAAHPDSVGAFVLDGVTDPLAGSPEGPFDDGFATLADDGTQAARDRFAELCNATDRCLFSLDANTILNDLGSQIPVLPTADFAGMPDQVSTDDYEGLLNEAVTYAGDWELLATALSDADRGDASAMAALLTVFADPSDTQTETDGDELMGESDFAEANFLIYCADLGPQITEWTFCDGVPLNRQPLTAVQEVDVERPILLIGTENDPLTPGYHAPEFAEALVDATHMIWEGVGHTAFPGWTPCIDRAVSAQFLREPVPADGTRCEFLLGVSDDEELGDELFGHGDIESNNLLRFTLRNRGAGDEASCIADAVNQKPDHVISHVVLDVTSDAAGSALDIARSAC
ncbi:MAG: pimeloyl-ACP methyl ester carboxylesterase [Candidatus Aldehydirespiratoraceae bacterium]|jgi:pimeloyl-ACP methyl ester carboxylesterase